MGNAGLSLLTLLDVYVLALLHSLGVGTSLDWLLTSGMFGNRSGVG